MRMAAWILVLLVLAVPVVFAAPTADVQNVTEGTAETYTPTIIDNNSSIQAGYVKEVNLSIEDVTDWWAGIYGNLTMTVVLKDAAGNLFYDWPVTTLSGYIYLVNATDFNWSGVSTAVATADVNAAIWQSATLPSSDENVEATFSNQDAAGNICSVAGAYYVQTYDNTGTKFWETCIYKDNQTPPRIAFEAVIHQDANAFDGTVVDYQALVAATAGGTTYYFYKG